MQKAQESNNSESLLFTSPGLLSRRVANDRFFSKSINLACFSRPRHLSYEYLNRNPRSTLFM